MFIALSIWRMRCVLSELLEEKHEMRQAIGSCLLAGGIFAGHSFYVNQKRNNHKNPAGTGQTLSHSLSRTLSLFSHLF